MANKPAPVLVIYRLKKGTEAQFKPLLAKHWPTLNKVGLVSPEKPKIWRTFDREDPSKVTYVEYMEWKTPESAEIAHQTPEVMQVWEPMGPILENLEILPAESVQF